MLGKTHKAGGALVAFVGVAMLQNKGMLLDTGSAFDMLASFTVIYPFTMWSSTLPDVDQPEDLMPDKNPVNNALNKILHLFNKQLEALDLAEEAGIKPNKRHYRFVKFWACRHRSWQTHSDITLLGVIGLLIYVMQTMGITSVVGSIFYLALLGCILGTLAHYILDMFTGAGISSFILTFIRNLITKKWDWIDMVKLRFVPSTDFFKTGETWEDIFRKTLLVATNIYTTWFVYIYVVCQYFPKANTFALQLLSLVKGVIK